MINKKARLITYYLPQFHPIPENDKWWGKGFTEWTNVTKAKPLFKGHYQPRFPADLGYYDLRVPEVRETQAQMAQDHGIEGFCYYHYWFGNGKLLLERPFKEVLALGKPDLPFCLCWANQTWQGVWFGCPSPQVLIEQTYSGKNDYEKHFNYLRPAFEDKRYITIDEKPLFHVYMPCLIPDLTLFIDTFREMAHRAGYKGIYLLGAMSPPDWNPKDHDFDGVVGSEHMLMRYYKAPYHEDAGILKKIIRRITGKLGLKNSNVETRKKPIIVDYKVAIDHLISKEIFQYDYFPCVIPNWDNTARSGNKGLVFKDSTPELWKKHLLDAIKKVEHLPAEHRIIMIKSWNEWAEGNYLEPDSLFGMKYLEAIKEIIF